VNLALIDHATTMDELCPLQVRVCKEFTQMTNTEMFERVVKLVSEIADAGRLNKKDALEQAVFKIMLLHKDYLKTPPRKQNWLPLPGDVEGSLGLHYERRQQKSEGQLAIF
jgi:hypothetical protein